jgi:hypothetical protein
MVYVGGVCIHLVAGDGLGGAPMPAAVMSYSSISPLFVPSFILVSVDRANLILDILNANAYVDGQFGERKAELLQASYPRGLLLAAVPREKQLSKSLAT